MSYSLIFVMFMLLPIALIVGAIMFIITSSNRERRVRAGPVAVAAATTTAPTSATAAPTTPAVAQRWEKALKIGAIAAVTAVIVLVDWRFLLPTFPGSIQSQVNMISTEWSTFLLQLVKGVVIITALLMAWRILQASTTITTTGTGGKTAVTVTTSGGHLSTLVGWLSFAAAVVIITIAAVWAYHAITGQGGVKELNLGNQVSVAEPLVINRLDSTWQWYTPTASASERAGAGYWRCPRVSLPWVRFETLKGAGTNWQTVQLTLDTQYKLRQAGITSLTGQISLEWGGPGNARPDACRQLVP